jgi:hypothetical protein
MPGKSRPFSRQSQQNQQQINRVGVSTMDRASIEKYKAAGIKVEVLWTPNPKQAIAIARKEREIAFCGARYGGKSSAGTLWMVMGNDGQPLWNEDGSPNLVNISYTHHPQFLGAVVRANEKDLSDWVQKALPYYTAINGVFTKNPAEFTFPSGARVFLGHAKDSDAWTKYQGQNIVRFYIDEAGLIPGPDTFDLLLASCRSIYPEMRAQMFLTANPGGPGQRFIFDRYIEPKDRYGKAIKHPTEDRPIRMEDGGLITIEEKVPHPFKHGEELTTTRVWVPSYMTDNQYAMNDPSYIASLATMRDEKMRKAMLFGDWRALSGVFFCCDDQTEFLTWDGFKPTKEIKAGELVATLSPAGEMTFGPCEAVHEYDYDGDLVVAESERLSFAVTPNHRMFCAPIGSHVFGFERADSLKGITVHPVAASAFVGLPSEETVILLATHNGAHAPCQFECPICGRGFTAKPWQRRARRGSTCSRACSYKFRAAIYGKKASVAVLAPEPTQKIIKQVLDLGDWLELLGWFISEGSLDNGYRVVISQQKHPDRILRIRELLTRMGITFQYDGSDFRFNSKPIWEALKPLGRAADKYIPREYLNCHPDLLKHLFEGLVLGDGFQRGSHWSYYTTSKQLASDIQELCQRLGRRATISARKQKIGRDIGYWVGISDKTTIMIPACRLKRRHYRGKVSCLTVTPHHTVLMRRNGRVMWTGNSNFTKQHLFDPKERTVAGWWKASGSLDWGFVHKSAALKHKMDPHTRQHLIYDEYSVSGVDPVELGAQLARWWEPELRIQGSVTIHTAHDCFSNKIGDFTWADLLAKGVNRVLGRDQCYLPDLVIKRIEEERVLVGRPGLSDDEKERILTKPITGIVFRRAPRATAVVWMHIRSLMSLESKFLHKPDPGTPDFQLAQSILEHGTIADYLAYLKSFQREKEWLPELIISTACKDLIAAIPKLIHDEDNPDTVDSKHFEGRDSADSLAYICAGVRDEKPGTLPPQLAKEKAMEEALAHNPNLSYQSKVWLAMQVEEQIAERERGSGGFTPARASRRLRAEAAAEGRRTAGVPDFNEWEFEKAADWRLQ